MRRLFKKESLDFIQANWRWGALNSSALCIAIYVLTQGSTGWEQMDTFDSGLESGKWAIRFLLTSLAMTPLNTYFSWKSGLKLRKSMGLWAFGFACAHVLLYIREAKLGWLTLHMPFYYMLGLAGMTLLTLLAVTSNRRAMQWLGKNWKRLHRLVYLSAVSVTAHSLLATMMSKKVLIRDPQAETELKVYIAVLAVLLVVRIPLVRTLLKQIPVVLRRPRKMDVQIQTLPMIQGRESGRSLTPTFVIPKVLPNQTEENSPANHPPNTNVLSFDPADGSAIELEQKQTLEPAGQR